MMTAPRRRTRTGNQAWRQLSDEPRWPSGGNGAGRRLPAGEALRRVHARERERQAPPFSGPSIRWAEPRRTWEAWAKIVAGQEQREVPPPDLLSALATRPTDAVSCSIPKLKPELEE